MTAPKPTPNYFQVFINYAKSLGSLAQSTTLPVAEKGGRIQTVIEKYHIPSDDDEKWENFDKCFNALYGDDVRDVDGCLPNVERGRYGLDLVVAYVNETIKSKPDGFPWNCAILKLSRLVKEIKSRVESKPQGNDKTRSANPGKPVKAPTDHPPSASSKTGKMTAFFSQKRKVAPTSDVPHPSQPKRKKATEPSDNEGSGSDDSDYVPKPRKGKRKGGDESMSEDSDVDMGLLDEDGEEEIVDTDARKNLEKKRKEKRAREGAASTLRQVVSKVKSVVSKKGGKPKKPSQTKTKKSSSDNLGSMVSAEPELVVLDSGEESDGDTALKKVQAAAERPQGARRGPANASMQHYKKPYPDTFKGLGDRWVSECEYCGAIRSVPRSIPDRDDNITIFFDQEPKIPNGMNNLATHLPKCEKFQKAMKELEAGTSGGGDGDSENGTIEFNYPEAKAIMDKFLLEGKLNPAIVPTKRGFLRIFAAWILDMNLPWSTGEAPLLAALFKYLKVNYLLPSDTTVRNELARLFIELHSAVVEEISAIESKIAFATDTWTTKQMVYTFACSIASFITPHWELVERVIDFKALESKEHEDNASVNDVIVRHVSRALLTLYDIPENPDQQIRCFAHILNLVVQAILSTLDEADECKNDGDVNDQFLMNKDAPIHYAEEHDTDLQELEAHRGDDLAEDGMDDSEEVDELFKTIETEVLEGLDSASGGGVAAQSALKRLRFIVTKIASSPQRRKAFWKISQAKYGDQRRSDPQNPRSALLCMLMIIRDVRTRWNSTHAMIKRALLLREAINGWVIDSDEFEGLLLSKKDWEQLEMLCKVLEPFADATRQLSASRHPTIPLVLPIYHGLDQKLVAFQDDPSASPALIKALRAGRIKLIKYKVPAFENHNYILGTALHPSLRSRWFRVLAAEDYLVEDEVERVAKLRKDQEEQSRKVEILLESVARTYQENARSKDGKSKSASSGTPAASSAPSRTLSGAGSLQSFYEFDIDIPMVEADLATPEEELQDELRRYIAFEGGRADLLDPLLWWKKHEVMFPILAGVARDILAIPATSVSVERMFSQSRQVCTDLRSSLHADTVRQALLTKTWIRSKLFELVPKPKPVAEHGSVELLKAK